MLSETERLDSGVWLVTLEGDLDLSSIAGLEHALSSFDHERAADVIYQPYLADGRWRGFADFLEKQPGGGYEPVDTKLARTAKPAHVLQLCFYAEQLARIQGAPVEHVHVENGRGERETFRVAEVESYYHRVRERFLAALDAEKETYPWPCDHCGICWHPFPDGEEVQSPAPEQPSRRMSLPLLPPAQSSMS